MTSLVLLATGAITLGAAALLMPSAMKPPPRPTPEVERIQVPSAALARPMEAGVVNAYGVEVASSREPMEPPPTENGAIGAAPPSASESASAIGSVAVAPPARSANGGTTIVAASAASVSASPSAIGGGPPASDLGADASVAANGDAGVALGDGGAVPYPPTYIAAPVYGAPPSSTSTAGPTTYGATGDASPLWSGGTTSIGGGGGGNASIVNPRPSIATTFLMTMSDADDPERAWTSLTPYLRPSDVVVAHVAGAGPSDVAFMDWGDRVHTDTPLVQYVVALDDASKLKDLVARGLPLNVNGVGIARTDGFDAATLNALSSAAHAAAKRFFVSASSASPVPLSQVGARADVVELVLASSDPTASVTEATSDAAQLRAAGAPTIFVRLPSGATSTSTATTFLTTLAGAAPNVGVSIPYGVGTGFLGDLRSSP